MTADELRAELEASGLRVAIGGLAAKQVADLLRISTRTLRRWREAGEGPRAVRLGGRFVYPLADLAALITESGQKRTKADTTVARADLPTLRSAPIRS